MSTISTRQIAQNIEKAENESLPTTISKTNLSIKNLGDKIDALTQDDSSGAGIGPLTKALKQLEKGDKFATGVTDIAFISTVTVGADALTLGIGNSVEYFKNGDIGLGMSSLLNASAGAASAIGAIMGYASLELVAAGPIGLAIAGVLSFIAIVLQFTSKSSVPTLYDRIEKLMYEIDFKDQLYSANAIIDIFRITIAAYMNFPLQSLTFVEVLSIFPLFHGAEILKLNYLEEWLKDEIHLKNNVKEWSKILQVYSTCWQLRTVLNMSAYGRLIERDASYGMEVNNAVNDEFLREARQLTQLSQEYSDLYCVGKNGYVYKHAGVDEWDDINAGTPSQLHQTPDGYIYTIENFKVYFKTGSKYQDEQHEIEISLEDVVALRGFNDRILLANSDHIQLYSASQSELKHLLDIPTTRKPSTDMNLALNSLFVLVDNKIAVLNGDTVPDQAEWITIPGDSHNFYLGNTTLWRRNYYTGQVEVSSIGQTLQNINFSPVFQETTNVESLFVGNDDALVYIGPGKGVYRTSFSWNEDGTTVQLGEIQPCGGSEITRVWRFGVPGISELISQSYPGLIHVDYSQYIETDRKTDEDKPGYDYILLEVLFVEGTTDTVYLKFDVVQVVTQNLLFIENNDQFPLTANTPSKVPSDQWNEEFYYYLPSNTKFPAENQPELNCSLIKNGESAGSFLMQFPDLTSIESTTVKYSIGAEYKVTISYSKVMELPEGTKGHMDRKKNNVENTVWIWDKEQRDQFLGIH